MTKILKGMYAWRRHYEPCPTLSLHCYVHPERKKKITAKWDSSIKTSDAKNVTPEWKCQNLRDNGLETVVDKLKGIFFSPCKNNLQFFVSYRI